MLIYVCLCMYVCVCMCVYIYIYTHMYTYVCVCVYIYIYIYIYTYYNCSYGARETVLVLQVVVRRRHAGAHGENVHPTPPCITTFKHITTSRLECHITDRTIISVLEFSIMRPSHPRLGGHPLPEPRGSVRVLVGDVFLLCFDDFSVVLFKTVFFVLCLVSSL